MGNVSSRGQASCHLQRQLQMAPPHLMGRALFYGHTNECFNCTMIRVGQWVSRPKITPAHAAHMWVPIWAMSCTCPPSCGPSAGQGSPPLHVHAWHRHLPTHRVAGRSCEVTAPCNGVYLAPRCILPLLSSQGPSTFQHTSPLGLYSMCAPCQCTVPHFP